MAKNFDIPKDNNIIQIPLEEAMPENYLPYAVEVAKDRALPDVRDGLKPVHRRILYGAYMLKAFPDKPYYKSARIVGDILGKYHPHGDSSVYDAMVILAQDFSTRMPLIDGHGNWGSVDGDGAAAMRYTEARLSKISMEILRDMDKDVVTMVDNYSDSEKEPTVLPCRYPNLLVNGTFGIAVGLSTNIPPHNLVETIDGTLALIDNKDITTKELMNYIKGPDLPTGGIIIGEKALESAYEVGEGKVTLRAKTSVEKLENDRYGIVITEFPYRKNKAKILQSISNMTGDKKHAKALDVITDIRDESDRNGIRAVIEFKKSCDKEIVEKVLKYLLQKTELQCNLSFNMVALVNGKPETLSLKSILYHYVNHQKDVVTRRTKKDLEKAEKRFHIVKGFIKAIGIMDEVIKTIRASKSKKHAQENLINTFAFTEAQSDAILELMLYRLTGLEIEVFKKEYNELEKIIKKLHKILSDEKELFKVIKKELIEIRDTYGDSRRTELVADDSKAKIDVEELIVEEDIMITMSNEGFIKRISMKSYNRSTTNLEDIEYREGDYNKFLIKANTKDTLLFFTEEGNAYQCKGVDIVEGKWKDKGERLDECIRTLDLSKENIYDAMVMISPVAQEEFLIFTSKGSIKRVPLSKFAKGSKTPVIKLKEDEKIVSINLVKVDKLNNFFKVKTKEGLNFIIEEQRELYKDKGTTPMEIINISSKDCIISAEMVEDFEYKVFPINVNSKGILKNALGRDSELGVYSSTDSILLLFSNLGKVYSIPAFMVQSLEDGGVSLSNLLEGFENKEKIVKLMSYYKDSIGILGGDTGLSKEEVILYTSKGYIKRCNLSEFKGKNLGFVETKLKKGDSLVNVQLYNEEENITVIVTKDAMVIKFEIDSLSALSKNALGVIGISLKEEDEVILGKILKDEKKITLVSKNGEEISQNIEDIVIQNRAGKGKNGLSLKNLDFLKKCDIK